MATKVEEQTVIQKIIKGLRLSPAADKIPNEINERIRVVYVANPEIEITHLESKTVVGIGSVIVFTTPADKDFFLTTISLMMHQNTPSTGLIEPQVNISLFFNGFNKNVIEARVPSKIADSRNVVITFPIPIKLDRNTNIRLAITAGDPNTDASASITGFTVEP